MNQGYGPQGGMQGAPPKKGMSGCIVALLVLAGVVVIGVVIVGYGAWRVYSSPEGQKLAKVVGESAKLAEEARTAPGTAELRKSGCQEAMVMDIARMEALGRDLADAAPAKRAPGSSDKLVVCQVGSLGKPPTCDAVARTFVGAAPPSSAFRVQVQVQGKSKATCEGTYAKDGTELEAP